MRFGIASSTLFATITTDASCGAINSWHDSYTPIGGMVPLVNIQLGEIIFGGVGSGLYGLLVFAILSVFIAGLMVGRTPEYLGKKIEQYRDEDGVARHPDPAALDPGLHGDCHRHRCWGDAIFNPGAAWPLRDSLRLQLDDRQQRLGLRGTGDDDGGNPSFVLYNWTGAFAMLIGRFAFVVPVMALAGSLVRKKVSPAGPAPCRRIRHSSRGWWSA